VLLALLAFLAAILYSSVGHGGASGYLAAMALAGMAPAEMKPTALVLNILVSSVGTVRFIRDGHFKFGSFWPFAITSIPFALVGGASDGGADLYKTILGITLCFAAAALLLPRQDWAEIRRPNLLVAVLIGSLIGYSSGLLGIGGGVFLSPILILCGWASTKETLGISALFILLNSIAGTAGHLSSLSNLPLTTPWLACAAFLGGVIGSGLAAKRLMPHWVRLFLVIVLLIAADKLLLT
jgi:uncharacterized membrane protein YfcA